MKIQIAALLSLTLIALQSTAKTEINVPPEVPATGFSLKVVRSHKTAQFKVWSDKSGAFYYGTNGERTGSGKLSPKNYKFLMDQVGKLSQLSSYNTKSCPRNYMMISTKKNSLQRSACIDATNETSKKTKDLANLLSLLI